MVLRRDLLKASLSVCGCATCGALGIGVSGGGARADGLTAISGTGYEFWFIGAQRETIMNGKLAAALDLKSLADLPHLIRRQGAHPDRTTVRLNFIDRR
jgi:hypothetical protein